MLLIGQFLPASFIPDAGKDIKITGRPKKCKHALKRREVGGVGKTGAPAHL